MSQSATKSAQPTAAASPLRQVEEYLDRLEAPLVGFVSSEERDRLRRETRYHLQLALEDRGDAALDTVFADYGDPEALAQAYLAAWFQRRGANWFSAQFGHANVVAFLCLLAVQFVLVTCLLLRVFQPSEVAAALFASPAEIRRWWPAPLPFPEWSWSFVAPLVVLVAGPVLAGGLIGVLVPVRPARAVYQAMAPIVAYSLVVATLLQPATEGLHVALFQIAFWLPVGCLSAHLSSLVARRRRAATWRGRAVTRTPVRNI